MSRFLSERFCALEAYTPGEQPQDKAYVKLNTNESPYPPCEMVRAAAEKNAARLHLYPDPECRVLREKLAARYGVKKENVFLSNGSDDILNFSFMAFCDQAHGVCYPDISYGFYPVYADLYQLPRNVLPLAEDFSLVVEDYFDKEGMVVIANPNAPTGLALDLEKIEALVCSNRDRVVLVDEAYVDFGAQSAVELVEKYDNLIIVRTYSKSRSMAGARLGFAIAQEALIEDLEKIKYSTNPYNINTLTLAAGEAALDNDAYYMQNCLTIAKTREYAAAQLLLRGFCATDSAANFLFTKPPKGCGKDYYLGLKQRGVLVRYFDRDRIRDYVRITVGTREQMDALLAATDDYLAGS